MGSTPASRVSTRPGRPETRPYTSVRFRLVRRDLRFYGRYKNAPIQWFANRYPRFYEEHLCWMFPAWYLVFDLEVVK